MSVRASSVQLFIVSAKMNSFQALRKTRVPAAASPLPLIGTMIRQKVSHQLHPSTRAASSISCGTDVKTPRMMKIVSARLKAV